MSGPSRAGQRTSPPPSAAAGRGPDTGRVPAGAQRGKLPPIVIGEPQTPPTQLPPQHSILFDQVRQHLPLLAVQTAGESQK